MLNRPLTLDDVLSVTDVEGAFGTTKFLPAHPRPIPPQHLAHRLAEGLFYNGTPPDDVAHSHFEFREPFQALRDDLPQFRKFLRAHLASFEPSHEHKMSGVADLIDQMMEFKDSP